jgi:signal transduction histidine kinase
MNTPNEVQLNLEQMERLFRISFATIPGVRHNLRNKLSAVLVGLRACKTAAEREWKEQLAERLDHASMAARASLETVDAALNFYRAPGRASHPFIASPRDVLESIKSTTPDLSFSFGTCEPLMLEFVYPSSALFTLLQELVGNAQRHSHDAAVVVVSWEMRGQRFVCHVEDNGPGISDDLTASYLPWEALALPISSGLALMQEIIRSSEGLLLFRRSKILNGTDVLIELPVLDYWESSNTRENDR